MKYVLDTNVLKKITGAKRNTNVDKWLATVDDTDIYITVLTVLEAQKGIEKLKKSKDSNKVKGALEMEADLEDFLADYAGRILPLDVSAARDWGRRLAKHGTTDANDLGIISIVATQADAVAVSQNIVDFRHRGITVIDPYKDPPDEYSDAET